MSIKGVVLEHLHVVDVQSLLNRNALLCIVPHNHEVGEGGGLLEECKVKVRAQYFTLGLVFEILN